MLSPSGSRTIWSNGFASVEPIRKCDGSRATEKPDNRLYMLTDAELWYLVLGVDRADVDRRVADMMASGVAVAGDGFACITGRSKSENPSKTGALLS
ncbi:MULTISPECIES: hypothetical protein [unclassified Bradyrhizobium]|uniref:hypothetical protein n=1 Tax=unclassified Bradyrhizobium TaxID=2631580 RepID=UPI0033964F96